MDGWMDDRMINRTIERWIDKDRQNNQKNHD